jgi:hypothetical protein
MTGGGLNSLLDIVGFLATTTNAELADEAIEAWELDQTQEDSYGDEVPIFAGFDRATLVQAFADLRADYANELVAAG